MIDWDELMRHEGPTVWRTAYRLLRNRHDADECLQETFLEAWKVAKRQPVRNWPALLHRLATNRAIDRVRQRMRRTQREEAADPALSAGSEADPVESAAAAELACALRWAIAQLPARQAEVFCLHELGDWTYQQIAEQLGMTANAVGVILHRARQKIQQLLEMQDRVSNVAKQQQPK